MKNNNARFGRNLIKQARYLLRLLSEYPPEDLYTYAGGSLNDAMAHLEEAFDRLDNKGEVE